MMVYGLRSTAALVLRGWLKLYHRLEITGRENLPQGGLVCHRGQSRQPSRHTLPAGRDAAAQIAPRFSGGGAGLLFCERAAAGARRGGGQRPAVWPAEKHPAQPRNFARQLLANPGNMLILFPEGTRTATGQIGEFKPGIGLLVAGNERPRRSLPSQRRFPAWPKGKGFRAHIS